MPNIFYLTALPTDADVGRPIRESIYLDDDNSGTVSDGDRRLAGPAQPNGTLLANFYVGLGPRFETHADPNGNNRFDANTYRVRGTSSPARFVWDQNITDWDGFRRKGLELVEYWKRLGGLPRVLVVPLQCRDCGDRRRRWRRTRADRILVAVAAPTRSAQREWWSAIAGGARNAQRGDRWSASK
jgi:hypothetical protein